MAISIVTNHVTDVRRINGKPVTIRGFAAVFMLAASPTSMSYGQEAQQSDAELPQIVVQGQGDKPKKPKKKPVAKKAPQPAVVEAAAPPTQPVEALPPAGPIKSVGSIGPGTGQPPDSFKVDNLQSSKATAPLLNTPQTVTVIPQQVLQERGAPDLTTALRNTPGITFDAGENGFATTINNFSIRGFSSAGNIFTDGVRNSGSFARDMFNVDRVEVVKGAAADNGRGGAAGYVNIVTKTPTDENFVRGESSLLFDDYGTSPLWRSTVDVNQRSGSVAVRLNGMYEDGGVMGRDVADLNAYGLAPSLAFGLGTETRAIFSYERLDRNDTPDWGVPGATVKGIWRYNPIAGQADREKFYGLASDFDDVTTDRVLARFEHDISDNFTISNQTVWDRADRNARYVIPTGISNPTYQFATSQLNAYQRENESFSNQTNLAGTIIAGGVKHTISAGFEYTREMSDANRFGTQDNPGGVTSLFQPNPLRYNGPWLPATQTNSVDIQTVSGYLYDTVSLNRQFDIVGGIRVEHYDVEIDSLTAGGLPTGIGLYEGNETTVGGKVGIVYKPVDEGSLYASYGVSALPPGSLLSNPDISRTTDNAYPGFVPGAKPIEAHNYEVGIKWDFFGGKLSTTAAAFHTEKKHVPVTGRDIGETVDSLKGYGEQQVQGIELGIAGNLTQRLKVFGGMLFLDSERRHSARLDDVRRRANANDYGNQGLNATTGLDEDAPGFPGVTRTSGDELAFTPNFSANLWLTYDVTDKLTLGGGLLYQGDSWLGRPDDALRFIPNGKYGKLPDYFIVNLMASYELTENVALRFNVDNVFDEDYAITTNWNGSRATLGAPRTYRIGTSFDF